MELLPEHCVAEAAAWRRRFADPIVLRHLLGFGHLSLHCVAVLGIGVETIALNGQLRASHRHG